MLVTPPPESTSLPRSRRLGDSDKLEGLEGMEHIVQLQLARINEMISEEKETGIKYPSLSREIHALSALTKTLTKAKEWELVHQGLDPVKRRKFEREKERLQQGWSSLMDAWGDEGRKKMIRALNELLERVEARGLFDMEVGEDGSYRITDPKTGEVIKTGKKGES